MTAHSLVLAIALGGALIAVWIDHRSAGRTPRTGQRVMLHVLVGLATASVVPSLMAALPIGGSPTRAMGALFALVLPMFVYTFLGWIWLLRLLQRLLRLG